MVRHVGILMVGLGMALLAGGLAIEFAAANQITGLAIGSLAERQLTVLDYSEGLLFSLAVMSLIMGTLFLSKSRAESI